MANNNTKKYPGKILAVFFPTKGGKQARCLPLTSFKTRDGREVNTYQEVINTLGDAGEGSKLVIREAPAGFRTDNNGVPAKYILEILTAEELAQERDEIRARTGSSDNVL